MDEVILLMEIVVEPIIVVMDVDVLEVLVDVVVHNIRCVPLKALYLDRTLRK